MKILLFGKNSQVGWELQRSLSPVGELVALDFDSTNGQCRNFTNTTRISKTIRTISPDIIVNTVAYTAVDQAETERVLAHQINAVIPHVLADEAQKLDAWLVHYSTDYVFDGRGTLPWKETDFTRPLSVYGKTKLDGEHAVKHCSKHLIFRTSWVYSKIGTNFVKTILRLSTERDQIKVIDDQIGAPTGAELLADVTAHAIRTVLNQPELGGVYHLSASGETSWHSYARLVVKKAHQSGLPIMLKTENVEAISSSVYPTAAQRPLNSRLDTMKLQKAFGLVLPKWQTGVVRTLEEISKSS